MVQLTFRLDAYTRGGDGPTDTYGVELRSHEVRGSIADGDWVEMPPAFNPRKPGKIKECLNLTTNERVFTKYRIWNTWPRPRPHDSRSAVEIGRSCSYRCQVRLRLIPDPLTGRSSASVHNPTLDNSYYV
jgi:hypothetical protein